MDFVVYMKSDHTPPAPFLEDFGLHPQTHHTNCTGHWVSSEEDYQDASFGEFREGSSEIDSLIADLAATWEVDIGESWERSCFVEAILLYTNSTVWYGPENDLLGEPGFGWVSKQPCLSEVEGLITF